MEFGAIFVYQLLINSDGEKSWAASGPLLGGKLLWLMLLPLLSCATNHPSLYKYFPRHTEPHKAKAHK